MKSPFIEALLVNIILITVIAVLAAVIFFENADRLLAIHYDVYRGLDLLGDRWTIFGIFIAALTVFVINLLLISFFYRRQKFLAYLLVFFTIFFLILILIALGVMMAIN